MFVTVECLYGLKVALPDGIHIEARPRFSAQSYYSTSAGAIFASFAWSSFNGVSCSSFHHSRPLLLFAAKTEQAKDGELNG